MRTRDFEVTKPGPPLIQPIAVPVSGVAPGDPGGNLPPMRFPTPPTARGTAPSRVSGDAPGGDGNDFGVEAAPTNNSLYNPGAREYVQPASSLPMSVSQREILAQNEGRADNMWPGNRSPLAGTVNDGGQ
jgi:hypothetical protein